MIRTTLITALLAGAYTPFVWAQEMDFGAVVESRYAFGTSNGKSQSAELEIRPEWEFALSDQLRFVGQARLRTDAFDRLEPNEPDQAAVAPRTRRILFADTSEIELREAFLEYSGDYSTVRLGKQQIVWGRADGLKLLDIVNPQSFREFILDDFDQSRTPLWSLMAERTVGNFDIQGVWVFDPTFAEIPPPGSIFEITSSQFIPTLGAAPTKPVVLEDPSRPRDTLGGSELGLQISGLVGNWNVGANYFYTHQDIPFFNLRDDGAGLAIEQNFNRVHVVGGSFANAFGDFTLRGELTLTFGENIPVLLNPLAIGPPVESDVFRYMLGLDYFGFSDTFVSLQFFQQFRGGRVVGRLVPEVQEFTTLVVRHDFEDDWQIEARWLSSLDDYDGLIQLGLNYALSDAWSLSVGGDFFYGELDGVFGQFDAADRVTMTARYAF